MTAVAITPFLQLETNGGLPLAGGKVFAYQAGTLIPQNTFTDRTATVANSNPVILDSAGRADIWLTANLAYKLILQDSAGNVIDSVDEYYAGADPAQLTAAGIVPSTGGTYTGLVEFTGGATFDGTPAQDLATLNSLGIQSVHNNNLWGNSDFSAFPNGGGSYADGALAFTKTSVLCDTGSVTVAQVSNPQNGVPYAMRSTQPDVGAKRIGFVQQVSAANTYFYRGQQLVLVPKVRCSISTTIRVALVAFTGTADTAPADVVNNWASTTYTAGNFFIANTSTIAVTATAVTAATFTDCLASSASAGGVVAPNGMNNLYMVVWTDLPVAQNVTLDIADVRCGAGTESPVWYPSDPSIYGRLLNVQRFTSGGTYTPTPGTTSVVVEVLGGGGGGGGSTNTGVGQVSSSGGGGAGGISISRFTSGFSGAAVTVGAAGGGGAINTAGTNGGTSTFLTATATGGIGGAVGFVAAASAVVGSGGGTGSGGNIANGIGAPGTNSFSSFTLNVGYGGTGGSSAYGSGGIGVVIITAAGNGAGSPSFGFGGGGGGASTGASQGGAGGGTGTPGLVIIREYS